MKSQNPPGQISGKGQYREIVDALKLASRAAAAKQIDLFRPGRQREVIVADQMGHTLRRDSNNNLVDAVDDEGRKYSYLSAHFGKRAQLLVPCRTPKELRTAKEKCTGLSGFIISHFSSHDACRLLTLWECSWQPIWAEIERQAVMAKGRSAVRPVYFTESFLGACGDGCRLRFRADDFV